MLINDRTDSVPPSGAAAPRPAAPDAPDALDLGVDVAAPTASDARVSAAQRRAEIALRDSEARYRALFESIDEGFCIIEVILDGDGTATDYRFVETNPAFEKQTGLANAVGRRMRELEPAHEAHWFEIYGRVAETGEPIRFRNRAAALGRWFDVYAFRVGEREERKVALLFKDVTAAHAADRDRERLLEALEVERARLAYIFQRAPAFLAVLRGPQMVFELVNDAYQQLVGHRPLLGRPLDEALPELREQGFTTLLDEVLATGVPFVGREREVLLARTPGAAPETRFVDFDYLPLVEADGTRSGVIAHGADVTEQVLARRETEEARDAAEVARRDAEAARERTSRLQELTAALARARTLDDVATVVVAEMVGALGARTGALAVHARDADDLVLVRYVGFPPTAAARVQRQPVQSRGPVPECFRTASAIWIELREGADGFDARYPALAGVWADLGVASGAYVPLVVAGEAVGVISFGFATPRAFAPPERAFLLAIGQQAALAVERARLFDAEHAARREAEAANRAKSEFLAVMSHELRTPLNAIGGYAELMEMGIRGPVTRQQAEDLRRIQTSQRHLLGLINEVLNYAKLETGAVYYDVRDVHLGDALAATEGLIAPQARAKGLTLVVAECPPDLTVQADADKLRQIVVNLLSNAVKFTDRGGRVELGCAVANGQVHVTVRDDGIGIPADKLEAIFEPFVQVRADLTRPHEGTGLGLAISRDLARGMGGDLAAASTPGKGSLFTLTLPRG